MFTAGVFSFTVDTSYKKDQTNNVFVRLSILFLYAVCGAKHISSSQRSKYKFTNILKKAQ